MLSFVASFVLGNCFPICKELGVPEEGDCEQDDDGHDVVTLAVGFERVKPVRVTVLAFLFSSKTICKKNVFDGITESES